MAKKNSPIYTYSLEGNLLNEYPNPEMALAEIPLKYLPLLRYAKANKQLGKIIISRLASEEQVRGILESRKRIQMYELRPVLLESFLTINDAADAAKVKPKAVSDSIISGHVVGKKYVFKKRGALGSNEINSTGHGILERKLTLKEQRLLLYKLFGFTIHLLDNDESRRLIIDEEGEEFYGNDANCQFHLDTLSGVFAYQKHLAIEDGKWQVRNEIKKVLGL